MRIVPAAGAVPDDELEVPVVEVPVVPVEVEPDVDPVPDVVPDDEVPDVVPLEDVLLLTGEVFVKSTRNVSMRVEHPNAVSAPSVPSQ